MLIAYFNITYTKKCLMNLIFYDQLIDPFRSIQKLENNY